jgi:uncharacterized protein (DUF934 family)
MSRLIRLEDGRFFGDDDRFTDVADDLPTPHGDVIVSLARFQSEGEALRAHGRDVGVRIEADQSVEDLTADLSRAAVVAAVFLTFPKFRDGRAFTSARLLRERFGYTGEVRAVGDVLREQAGFMVRCGFNAFAPADGSTPEQWAAAANRFRHVYQRAADAREPAFAERAEGAVGGNHGLRRV